MTDIEKIGLDISGLTVTTHTTLGPISKGKNFYQRFMAQEDGLSAISLWVGTYCKQIDSIAKLSILDADKRQVIRQIELDTKIINDNSWQDFCFNPISESKGRVYWFCFESNGEKEAVTLWTNNKIKGFCQTNDCYINETICFKCNYNESQALVQKLDVNAPMVVDEHFVPPMGLDLELYIQAGDIGGVHHLIRYKWALECIGDLNNPKTILDVACGSGYGSYLIAKKYPNIYVIGADYDYQSIKLAQKNYLLPNLEYKYGDVTLWNETIGSTKFDCIISFDTIEHVEHREIMMQNLVEYLQETGCLLFSTPCTEANSLKPEWEYHKIEYSWASLYDFLRRYFNTICSHDDRSLPHWNVFEHLKSSGIEYSLKMNPVVCKHPIKIANPYY